MNKRTILFGIIGLLIGFSVSFFWTKSINQSGTDGALSGKTGAVSSTGMGGDSQAVMAQAQERIKKARDNPKDFDAQFEAALAYDHIGRAEETVEFLKRAYLVDPSDGCKKDIPRYLGQYYFEKPEYTEAESWFLRQLECDSRDVETLTELAAVYIEKESPEPEKALIRLNAALRINPRSEHALIHLAQAYIVKKDAAGATDALSRLKSVNPANSDIQNIQAQIDLLKGKS